MSKIDPMAERRVCIIRRNYRADGGAEVATSNYIEALSKFSQLTLACESWEDSKSTIRIEKLESEGRTRASRYKRFINTASNFVENFEGISHSHELVPGCQVLRLGDGVHHSWLKAAGWSWKALLDPFHRYKTSLEKQVLQDERLKYVIVNSNFVGRDVETKFGIEPSRLRLIRNIVRREFKETPINRSTGPGRRMVFVGSGWYRKGLHHAIRVLRSLPNEITLDIFGIDRSISRYERLVASLGLQARVFFRGMKTIEPQDLDQFDLMVHPAIYEPFPNVAIEALSRGLAVVSSFQSGTSDFDKTVGVATCEISDESLVEGIRWAIDSSPKDRLNFRDHIVQFDQNYLIRSVESLYGSLR